MSDVRSADLEQRSQREGDQRHHGRLRRLEWAVMPNTVRHYARSNKF